MQMYFSRSTGGFYADDIHAKANMPKDAVAITPDEYKAALDSQANGLTIQADSNGKPVGQPPLPPTSEQVKASLTFAVQQWLDSTAQTLGYDSIVSAVSYAEEAAVPAFQAQGQALRAWRSQVWAACISVLADVTSGKMLPPTPPELIKLLPAFVAPTTA